MPAPDPKKGLKDLALELVKINKELDKTKDVGGKKRGAKELETGALTTILDALARSVDLVKTLLEKGSEDNCPRVKILEEKTRALEDQSDHHHQRSLKGKFMISSLKTNNIIASEEKLKEGGKSTPRYVTELLFNKLGVRVKEEEITSCHHTNSGMLIFRLGDFKPGSSFHQVVTAIKSGAGKDVTNLFVNFALTPRRAALLYEVRQLKKSKKITRFLSDSDGSITVVKTDGSKMKVTSAVKMRGANFVDKDGKGPNGGAVNSKATQGSFPGKASQGSFPGKTLTKEEIWAHFSA